jgi:N-carbamoyl-L-amino-acid hydrolase
VDLRDIDSVRRDRIFEEIKSFAKNISDQRQVEIDFEVLNADAPASSSPHVLGAIRAACSATGVSSREIVSRAYHDSLFMSRLAPMAMIFIPCRDGVSHRPDEFAAIGNIATGVEVLARALAELASEAG